MRNLLASTAKTDKDKTAKAKSDAVLKNVQGNYTLAFLDDTDCWNGLAVSVAAKGKVKVSGKLANGTSVSTSTQLIVGDEMSCIPVIYTKKDNSLAFSIYFDNESGEMSVFGYADALISPVSQLRSGLSFNVYESIYDLFEDYAVLEEFLPYGVSVEPSGTKWIVADGAKAGTIKLVDGEAVDTKESANPSGLKLTYAARNGTFKGAFKVYALDANNRLKSFQATVSGVVVDGYGFGSVTVKKFGSVGATIE